MTTVAKKPTAPKKPAAPKKVVGPKKVVAPKPASSVNTIHPPVVKAEKVVAPKKPAPAPKAENAIAKAEKEARVLYTFRLEPHLIAKLEARGAKEGVTHAAIARNAVAAYLK